MICEKEYKVVVTACAAGKPGYRHSGKPFKENEKNPTQDVKLALPDRIEREGRVPIKIIKYHTDFRNVIRDMDIIPQLWIEDKRVYEPDAKEGKKIHIDAMLHLGMNFADYWQVEKRARRDGYDWTGDDGVPLPSHNGDKGGRWEGLPDQLRPVFDVDGIPCTDEKSRPALCSSTTQEKKTAKEDIEEGARVAAAVIRSMVDQLEGLRQRLLDIWGRIPSDNIMRLLEIESRTLKEFSDKTRVSYAILSHRWEDDEVLFQDLTQGTASLKRGWKKVENFCRVAQKEGFRYVWIDTCCIDKSSSAELSEAINSMYRWYQNADTCFAYLNDCSYEAVRQPGSTELQKSKWFTRGWTLQELIAPAEVVFLSAEWREFGTRRSLASEIGQITNIDPQLLFFPARLNQFCAAQKLSWAATRETTRIEDRAYSLMGLFSVNMPLLYGEGNKAFFRLQMEILQSVSDQSIFAWKHNPQNGFRIYSSILATSLGDFEGCHRIRHTPRQLGTDQDSGVPELPQQVVGPFIKLKALSIPYDGSFNPSLLGSEQHRQQPPWLTSVYKEIYANRTYARSRIWVVFLVDCSEEDGTIGIALRRTSSGFYRYHGPSRFRLPRVIDCRGHADLKERLFHVRSLINDTPIIEQSKTLHLRRLPAEYGLRMTTPVLLDRGNRDSKIYRHNNETHPGSIGTIITLWKGIFWPSREYLYFSLEFRTRCGTDSLPPFHLEFWHALGSDHSELSVLFGKGALTQNHVPSPRPSSLDLLLGPREFELMTAFVLVVKARNGTGNKILLSIFVENKWTGDPSGISTEALQGKMELDA
ncbi:uncharacterized protein NECHADRAFT_101749 [Fusarium vanettenii 77-13-4]|uniref:Uncharacterized protein n=1 Tax=Fusarium vanettenii (strain ATCC MYA-4622 / CBS 123669 / FGSC 9596 / NRRL 45880 / 77-13-4) TaxID=660122 RepID=C7YVC9_FUSV7|nr:uncharacterized protein NECHADRAFT_101749 [Fusarium vanettenii 77-13-4]EEU44562.1 hypothetical protein NECHADRAFT_101749 [Fusarium vanettenii 77-13-4]